MLREFLGLHPIIQSRLTEEPAPPLNVITLFQLECRIDRECVAGEDFRILLAFHLSSLMLRVSVAHELSLIVKCHERSPNIHHTFGKSSYRVRKGTWSPKALHHTGYAGAKGSCSFFQFQIVIRFQQFSSCYGSLYIQWPVSPRNCNAGNSDARDVAHRQLE
jgi:hypothetical protein